MSNPNERFVTRPYPYHNVNPTYICNMIKERGIRFVTLRRFSVGRVSGSRSLSCNVAGGSSCPSYEGHTMYRRAHPSSDFQKRRFRPLVSKECGICDHRRERWRDPCVVGVEKTRGSPRRPRNDIRRVVLVEDSKSTRREVGCIKPLTRTNTLTLFIIE